MIAPMRREVPLPACTGCVSVKGKPTTNQGEPPEAMSPNDIIAAITGRPYLSYSQVSMFQACPLKWWFSYVQQAAPESIHAGMLLGSAIHAAIQSHTEAQLAGEPMPALDQLMSVYHATWHEEADKTPVQLGGSDTAESLAETARQILATWLESPLSQPAGPVVGVEELFYARMAEDLPDLAVRLDRVHVETTPEGDSELVISDYKTTRSMWSPNTAQEHAEQLILYSLAANEMAGEFNAGVKLQFIVLTKAKTPRVEAIVVQPTIDRAMRLIQIVRQVFQAMQTGIVYPVASQMNCTACGHRRRCAEWEPLE